MDLYKYSIGKVFCVNTETDRRAIPRIMKIFIFHSRWTFCFDLIHIFIELLHFYRDDQRSGLTGDSDNNQENTNLTTFQTFTSIGLKQDPSGLANSIPARETKYHIITI